MSTTKDLESASARQSKKINPGSSWPVQYTCAIYNLDPYINWKLGQKTICLDGEFSLDLLKAIIQYMEQ